MTQNIITNTDLHAFKYGGTFFLKSWRGHFQRHANTSDSKYHHTSLA